MIDLSKVIENLILYRSMWTSDSVGRIAVNLARRLGGSMDWDADAGETWASVIIDDRRVAIISTALPLAFSAEDVDWNPEERAEVKSIIPVSSFDAAIFCCDTTILTRAFGSPDRLELVDHGRFSADDLWYATI
ncbi:hypothetical protein [Kibdelosporangium aridum]|uniref:hypothetical protein n=1 Tax=Kibdelosporangium aridum TaxID=2030 RepID=UPI00117A5E95|nr:hypothetical protein [Kibdelosporangium aridum]